VKISEVVVLQILHFVSAEFAVADLTKTELESALANFRSSAEKRAVAKLREFCHNNETAPLTTGGDEFRRKIHEAQCARFVAALLRYRQKFPPEAFYSVLATAEPKPSTEPTIQREESKQAVTSQQDIQLLRAEQQRVQHFLRGSVIVKNDSIDQLFEQNPSSC
jgi:Rps23 Pro-64 3,4-dihydroxylase Tpa1-like proline 4-hydroxylase